MTMAVGLQTEAGLVLATDSMTLRAFHDGQMEPILDGRKFAWLPGWPIAMTCSCTVPSGSLQSLGLVDAFPDSPALEDLPPVVEAVGTLYEGLMKLDKQALKEELRVVAASPEQLASLRRMSVYRPQMLAAVCSASPQLVRVTPNGEEWAKPGAVLAIGGWLFNLTDKLRIEMALRAPDSLAACRELAIEWARRYIKHHYGSTSRERVAEMIREARFPTAAFPLNVLTVTASEVIEEEIEG